jgi:hypothetical protein
MATTAAPHPAAVPAPQAPAAPAPADVLRLLAEAQRGETMAPEQINLDYGVEETWRLIAGRGRRHEPWVTA